MTVTSASASRRPPIHVVMPVKDQLALTRAVVGQLVEQAGHERLWLFDNGSGPTARRWFERAARRGWIELVDAPGWTLHQMWNAGLARAHDRGADAAILNNDLVLGPELLVRLQRGLRSRPDLWAVSPCYDQRPIEGVELVTSTFKHGGLAGFAFLLAAEAYPSVRFDEAYRWWYGDDDLVAQIEAAGRRVALVGDASVVHVGGGSRTVRYDAQVVGAIEADLAVALRKWFGPSSAAELGPISARSGRAAS